MIPLQLFLVLLNPLFDLVEYMFYLYIVYIYIYESSNISFYGAVNLATDARIAVRCIKDNRDIGVGALQLQLYKFN